MWLKFAREQNGLIGLNNSAELRGINSWEKWQSLILFLNMEAQELFKAIPYVVTLVVLIITSMRKKREYQPPASLGLNYFREER